MSIGIGDNFNYQGSKFNMDRDSFQTKEAMKNYPETSLPPKGFRAYCAEDDEYYEFNVGNSVDPDTGKWRMVDNPTAKKTVEDAKTNGDYAKEQGDAAKEAARKVTNDVLFKVFQSLTEEEQIQVKQNIGIGVEQKFQGQFESYSELEGVSSPAVGDYAYVGNPRNLYAYKSSGWVNLGEFNYNIDQELDEDSERGIANGVVTREIANIESNIGISDYPTFSENTDYLAGSVVNYNGELYQFTSEHPKGAWLGTDVKKTNIGEHLKQITDADFSWKYIRGYIDTGGVLVTNWNNYVHSQYISFTKEDEMVYSITGIGTGIYPIVTYDKNFNFLGLHGVKGGTYSGYLRGLDLEENVAFVVFNWSLAENSNHWSNILRGSFSGNNYNLTDILPRCYVNVKNEPITVTVNNTYSISRFIPIKTDKKYAIVGSSYKATDYYNVNFYDENYNWISGYRENSIKIVIGTGSNCPIPENAKFIRLVLNNSMFSVQEEEETEAYNFIKENGGIITSDDSDVILDGFVDDNGIINSGYTKYKHTKKIRINKNSETTLVVSKNQTTGTAITQVIGYNLYGGIVKLFGIKGGSVFQVLEIKKSEYPDVAYIVFNITVSDGETNYISILEGSVEPLSDLPYIDTLTGAYVYEDGTMYNYDKLCISRFIPLKEGMVVCGTDYKGSSYYNIIFYNVDFQLLEGYREDADVIEITSDKIPENAKYIRLNVTRGKLASVYTNNDKYLINLISKTNNNKLRGKTFWTLFDSLGASSQWQKTFVKLTEAIFHEELNSPSSKPISWGGSTTGPTGGDCGLARAKNLVSYKDSYPIDYLFIENINDMQKVSNGVIKGSIADAPWMQGDEIVGREVFESQDAAWLYVNNNLQSVVSSVPAQNRKKGAYITFPYKATSQNAYLVKILSKATSNGTAYVVLDSQRFGIEVTTEMSIQDIINAIENYSFGAGWSDVDNGDGSITIGYYTNTSSVISFDANGTGIQSEVTKTYNTWQMVRYFTGYSASEWEEMDKWVDSISLWSMYKGLLEYLKENLPNTLIYWFIPTRYSVPLNSSAEYVKSDGTFDIDKYRQTDAYKNYKALTDCQKEVCDYYDIPVVDIESNCNINLFNLSTFYTNSNVHPKQAGYDRWALTLYNLIC